MGHGVARAPAAQEIHLETEATPAAEEHDILSDDKAEARETFLPITRAALVDRLTRPQAWERRFDCVLNKDFFYNVDTKEISWTAPQQQQSYM